MLAATRPPRPGGADPFGFCFSLPGDVGSALVEAARHVVADGPLTLAGLERLRPIALGVEDTITDAQRLFMTGLFDTANAKAFLAARGAVTFLVGTIDLARLDDLRAIGRPRMPGAVIGGEAAAAAALAMGDTATATGRLLEADEAAARAIRRLAEASAPLRAAADALVAFADTNGYPVRDVLRAMIATAADSTPADLVMAGVVYATARKANHPVLDAVMGGEIMVDAVAPRVLDRLVGSRRPEAICVSRPTANLAIGTTLYLSHSCQVDVLKHRLGIVLALESIDLAETLATMSARQLDTRRGDRSHTTAFAARAQMFSAPTRTDR